MCWAKKILVALLTLALALSLGACGVSRANIDKMTPPADESSCKVLGKAEALAFLARFSSMTPAQRISKSTGQAQDIYKEEAAFVDEGWPPAFMQGWMRDAWKDVSVQSSEGATILNLKHGNPMGSTITRFELVCQGGWVVQRVGTAHDWYAPAPVSLPGQGGKLTEKLAMDLATDALLNYGTTRMRVSAMGPELERGRLLAVAVAAGATLAPQRWGGIGPELMLVQETTDRAVGHWIKEGVPTGEKILFIRSSGLWKLADHTEAGSWAPASRPGFDKPRDLSDDTFLLGLALGMSSATVEQVAGKPDQVKDGQYIYSARNLTVTFDDKGEVSRIETSTGATWRGLRIGDPLETVTQLYGQPMKPSPEHLTYTDGPRRMHVQLESEGAGKGHVIALVLERSTETTGHAQHDTQSARNSVSPDEITALLREVSRRSHSLTWQEPDTAGKAALSRNGDRYFLPFDGDGFVQMGLRTWGVKSDPKGNLTWEGPYAGPRPQFPFLNELQAHPGYWGIEQALQEVKTFRREPRVNNGEVWTAEIPSEGLELTWQLTPRQTLQLQIWLRVIGTTLLPVRWEAETISEGRRGKMEGTYEWVEPVIPADPRAPANNRELGLFQVWLGESKIDAEPLRFGASERRKEADGSQWAIGEGRAIKYNPSGKVVVLSQTQGSLLNGLSIGDDANDVMRYFGPVPDPNQPVYTYRFPLGSRLEILFQEGKVSEIRAVAAGQP